MLDTDDSLSHAHILDSIYSTELQLGDSSSSEAPPHPVGLKELQQQLAASEVLVEYVLGDPHSYALALTRESAHRYVLASKNQLERDSTQYRSTLLHQKADTALGQHLFYELLGGIRELDGRNKLIVVPDGKLHLLPFAALVNGGHYLVSSYEVSVAPSGTVLDILRHRSGQVTGDDLSYVGVAAWVPKSQPTSLLAMIRRSMSGPVRRELVALPESEHEVETIATDLPKPNTVLLGDRATESNFKQLPLSRFAVIHLTLHGYVDPEIPDRSALVFAPESAATDDGLLQVREIRTLPINANLVTLSACNTGVGPVGEEGVENIVNAFIEAGAESVVSTLWELQDHSTAQLMTSFYAHLGKGEEKAEALRKAQLEILNSGAPPYYWAGVELDGEPDGKLFDKVRTNTPSRSGE